jgi:acetylornithine deacetylase/succinyl-diaminopimelate desuccinylase-like protein
MSALEADPAYPGREVDRDEEPVVAARVVGNGRGPTVVLTGHADVVPIGDRSKWTRDPAGELDGDVLYGRADMTGGIVASIEAFTRVANSSRDSPAS